MGWGGVGWEQQYSILSRKTIDDVFAGRQSGAFIDNIKGLFTLTRFNARTKFLLLWWYVP